MEIVLAPFCCYREMTAAVHRVRVWDIIVMIVCVCSAPRCRIMYMEQWTD
jgi:hypothetical protein